MMNPKKKTDPGMWQWKYSYADWIRVTGEQTETRRTQQWEESINYDASYQNRIMIPSMTSQRITDEHAPKKMVFRGPKKDIEILNDDTWFEDLGWSGWVLVSNVSCTSIENDNLPIDEIDVEVEWAVNEM